MTHTAGGGDEEGKEGKKCALVQMPGEEEERSSD